MSPPPVAHTAPSDTVHSYDESPPHRELTVTRVDVFSCQEDPLSSRQAVHPPGPGAAVSPRVLFRSRLTLTPEVVVFSTLPRAKQIETTCTAAPQSRSPPGDTSAAVSSRGCKLAMAPMEIQSLHDSHLGFEDHSTTHCVHVTSSSLRTETLPSTSDCAHVQSSTSATSAILPSSCVLSTCEDKDPGHSTSVATGTEPSTSFEDILKSSMPNKATEISIQDDTSSAIENLEVPLADSEKNGTDMAHMAVLEDLNGFKHRMLWLMERYQERQNHRKIMKQLLVRTRGEVENLKATLRTDAGDSWFKGVRDPESVRQLQRRQEALCEMLTKINCELEWMRQLHCVMKVVQDDAKQCIMAAKRKRESNKMAAEDVAGRCERPQE